MRPTLRGAFQSEPDPRYVEYLTQRIAEGIATANGKLAPAMVRAASESNPAQVFNRRWKREQALMPADPFGGPRTESR